MKKEKLSKMLTLAEIALAVKPPKIDEVRFVEPTVIDPVVIGPTGQERRRERRKRERMLKRK